MNMDKYTVKASEAVQEASSLAQRDDHSQIESEHLLYVLLEQEDGIVPPIVEKIGVQPDSILDELDKILDKKPRVTGQSAQTYMSPLLAKVFAHAEGYADKLKDDYVSTEHFLLALTEAQDSAGNLLRSRGINFKAVLSALKEIRGNNRVTTDNPESTFQSLEKFCRDLTQLARQEKIDPVIGRDEEIRRVM
ncbi:Clp protease N-terminal domain-containing protein, partial [Treponema pedis]